MTAYVGKIVIYQQKTGEGENERMGQHVAIVTSVNEDGSANLFLISQLSAVSESHQGDADGQWKDVDIPQA